MRREIVKKYLEKYSLGVVDAGNSIDSYNSFCRNMGIGSGIEAMIGERLEEKVFVKVMDIGCGDCGFLGELKKMFGEHVHTIGVDLLAPLNGPDHMVIGDALEAAFPREVDFVFSFRAMHEIGEPEKMVKKVYACLAPGGRAFLSFRTMDLHAGVQGMGEIGEKEVKALRKMVRSRKLGNFIVDGREVSVSGVNGKKLTAGVNVFLEK
ncbi:MAG: class I SAM-dependent methyltransferase [Candidatus Diapherotrites archaeon]|uniref:Class I SAM-dependent methyltransferase n=1 Tax=Candidatus Iainarchaeum sp. TaxID=3101447 RepID=A0A8T3YKW0_9ARCH|nr:class I SAM-dependent methyltransferase [Candidatus Diapherotrites archaeon]